MLKVNSYSVKGTKLAAVSLPKALEEKENLKLLAQAIYVYTEKAHVGLAKAKTRAEVNRTTKKLYRQKGTGGARHGSRRAPIFVGGGVAHGPRPIRRELSLPKKMARKALKIALSQKVKEGKAVVVDKLATLKKTREAKALIGKIGAKKTTFVLAKESLGVKKTLANLDGVSAVEWKDLNPYSVFFGGTLILDKAIFKAKK